MTSLVESSVWKDSDTSPLISPSALWVSADICKVAASWRGFEFVDEGFMQTSVASKTILANNYIRECRKHKILFVQILRKAVKFPSD
jgi:hypothetical protein